MATRANSGECLMPNSLAERGQVAGPSRAIGGQVVGPSPAIGGQLGEIAANCHVYVYPGVPEWKLRSTTNMRYSTPFTDIISSIVSRSTAPSSTTTLEQSTEFRTSEKASIGFSRSTARASRLH